MQEVNDLNNEGKTLLYPRMIIKDCCSTDELAEWATRHTTFSPAEVKGALEVLRQGMIWQMSLGRSVHLEGIGTFTPGLTLRKGKEREQPDGSTGRRNAASIQVGRIHFKADKSLPQDIGSECHLERSNRRFVRKHSKYTPEQRLALAQKHLKQHGRLYIGTYAYMTGLSKSTAGRELRRWLDTPGTGIDAEGTGSHRFYVPRPEPDASATTPTPQADILNP